MWITRSKSYKKLAKLSVLCLKQLRIKVEPEENEDKQNLQINRIDQYQFQIKVDSSSFEIDEKAL